MTKRITLLLALAILALAPTGARAHSTLYVAPWEKGPQGGDNLNHFVVDQKTGDMTVLRTQPAGISGGLGCGGNGGYSNFKVTHDSALSVRAVTVSFHNAVVDPYTFINVNVLQGGAMVKSVSVRGPIAGTGTARVAIPEGIRGPLEVWFGIQVASACPNVDGGSARFTMVSFSG